MWIKQSDLKTNSTAQRIQIYWSILLFEKTKIKIKTDLECKQIKNKTNKKMSAVLKAAVHRLSPLEGLK